MNPDQDKQIISELHAALDRVLILFVTEHGFGYEAVRRSLDALSKSGDAYNLPISKAFADSIRARRETLTR